MSARTIRYGDERERRRQHATPMPGEEDNASESAQVSDEARLPTPQGQKPAARGPRTALGALWAGPLAECVDFCDPLDLHEGHADAAKQPSAYSEEVIGAPAATTTSSSPSAQPPSSPPSRRESRRQRAFPPQENSGLPSTTDGIVSRSMSELQAVTVQGDSFTGRFVRSRRV